MVAAALTEDDLQMAINRVPEAFWQFIPIMTTEAASELPVTDWGRQTNVLDMLVRRSVQREPSILLPALAEISAGTREAV